MRLRLNSIGLEGISRPPIEFRPGLNVIVGPVSTGKSSLMRLLRIGLGGDIEAVFPEVKATVEALALNTTIDDSEYFIRRRLVSTSTAAVEIAGGNDEVLSLPAMRASASEPLSYGDWLLEKLGLPRLEVPTAPTRPAESGTTPVSINDYLRYCRLTQEEIDVDILGSSVWFKDNKRRIVFRILYGSYDARVAELQQELRELQSELRVLQADETAFARFLQGTAFANRADLEARRARAQNGLAGLTEAQRETATAARRTPRAEALRAQTAHLDGLINEASMVVSRERRSTQEMLELRNQLQTKSGRLTRAIVAGELFFDFDFRVCPRCGSSVDMHRASDGDCYLCLQPEPTALTRDDLVREQARVNVQIGETEDLVAAHTSAAINVGHRREKFVTQRAAVGYELDMLMEGFVSDQAEELTARAVEMSALDAEVARLDDYIAVFDKFADGRARVAELTVRVDQIETELAAAERVDAAAEERIETLEERFAFFVDNIQVPTFAGQPRAAIDRNNYEPIVNGRHLDGLSAGVRVLVNVAHSLAHHLAAVDIGLPLPGLLLIDGITKNIGTAQYDAKRTEHVWQTLVDLHEVMADDLQVVVAANDVPAFIDERFVVMRLAEDDRLVPTADLDAIGWDAPAGGADDGG